MQRNQHQCDIDQPVVCVPKKIGRVIAHRIGQEQQRAVEIDRRLHEQAADENGNEHGQQGEHHQRPGRIVAVIMQRPTAAQRADIDQCLGHGKDERAEARVGCANKAPDDAEKPQRDQRIAEPNVNDGQMHFGREIRQRKAGHQQPVKQSHRHIPYPDLRDCSVHRLPPEKTGAIVSGIGDLPS